MSDPIPPDEWSSRIQRRDAESGHFFPPRPEVVEATESDLVERAHGPVEHEGHRPTDAPLRPAPQLLPPEQQRAPLWRRPPGQHDDLGEPTGQTE
jgi:hypothetical protein